MNRRNLLKTLAISLGNMAIPFSYIHAQEEQVVFIESYAENSDGILVTFASKSRIDARTMALTGPSRIVVDFFGTLLLPEASDLRYTDKIIKKIRTGRQISRASRVVFDLHSAARVTASSTTVASSPINRLMVQITPTPATDASQASALSSENKTRIVTDKIQVGDTETAFVFQSDLPIVYRTIRLDNPGRLAVDFNNAGIQNIDLLKKFSNQAVSKVRVGHPFANTSRVVFELADSVTVGLGDFSTAYRTENNNNQLVVAIKHPIQNSVAVNQEKKPLPEPLEEETAATTPQPTETQDETVSVQEQVVPVYAQEIIELDDATHFSFLAAEKIRFKYFELIKPNRVVVDLYDANLNDIDSLRNYSNHFIAKVRVGRPFRDRRRIVFNIRPDYTIKPEITHNDSGSFMTVQLTARQKGSIVEAETVAEKPPVRSSPVKKAEPTLNDDANIVVKEEKKPQIIARQMEKIIVIDPGHGGIDPGAIGKEGTKEKDIALAVAKVLLKKLDGIRGCKAFLTRDNDRYIPLSKRLDIAKSYQANLFLSLHADAFHDSSINGASVYCLSENGYSAVMEADQELAERENSVFDTMLPSLLKTANIPKITNPLPTRISSRKVQTKAKIFGHRLLKSLEKDENISIQYNQVKQAEFKILKTPGIPSALVEMAFLSNINDERKMRDENFQENLSVALSQGILHQLKLT
jgi:N-acetylmuramoyl-L-alanine amidase